MYDLEDQPAKIRYDHGIYKILDYGDYVLCAFTGRKIPLEELCYWNVEHQEAYCNANAALQCYLKRKNNTSTHSKLQK